MLTKTTILAHTLQGKNLVFLTQVENSFFLVFAQAVKSWRKTSLKVVTEKQLTLAEAKAVFARFTQDTDTAPVKSASATGTSSETLAIAAPSIGAPAATVRSDVSGYASDILLLEAPKKLQTKTAQPKQKAALQSPYFPTKDIFLSTQQTRAPSTLK